MCCSFINGDRRQEIPGSETKDIFHSTAGSMGFMSTSVSLTPQVPWRPYGEGLRWRKCTQWVSTSEQRDFEIRKPQLCLRANLPNQPLPQRETNLHHPEQWTNSSLLPGMTLHLPWLFAIQNPWKASWEQSCWCLWLKEGQKQEPHKGCRKYSNFKWHSCNVLPL